MGFSRTEEAAAIVCNHGEGRVVAGEPLRCIGRGCPHPTRRREGPGEWAARSTHDINAMHSAGPLPRYVVEDHGGPTSPLFSVSDLTTREDAGGWTQVTPEPCALRCPYSVLSFDRIGR